MRGNRRLFDPFSGKVGDSDLQARSLYTKAADKVKPPLLQAKLDLSGSSSKDLGPLVGAPPGFKPASPRPRAAAKREPKSTRALAHPSRHALQHRALGRDGGRDVTQRRRAYAPRGAARRRAGHAPRRKDSVLHLHPLDFGVAGGPVRTNIAIDGRERPPLVMAEG